MEDSLPPEEQNKTNQKGTITTVTMTIEHIINKQDDVLTTSCTGSKKDKMAIPLNKKVLKSTFWPVVNFTSFLSIKSVQDIIKACKSDRETYRECNLRGEYAIQTVDYSQL